MNLWHNLSNQKRNGESFRTTAIRTMTLRISIRDLLADTREDGELDEFDDGYVLFHCVFIFRIWTYDENLTGKVPAWGTKKIGGSYEARTMSRRSDARVGA